MKSRKAKTQKIARALMERPTIVADIFSMGADKMPVPEIVDQVNKFWPEELPQDIEITEHYIWALFHRKAPFQNPDFYREVDEEHKRKVAERLYSTTPSFSLDDEPDITNVQMIEPPRSEVLQYVLSARIAYEKSLDEAVKAGMCRDAVEVWTDDAVEVMQ